MHAINPIYIYVKNIDELLFCCGVRPLISYARMYHQAHILHKDFAFHEIDIHKFWSHKSNYNHKYNWVQRQCINTSTWNWDFLISFQYKYKSTSCNFIVNSDIRQLEWHYLIHLCNNKLIILSFTVFTDLPTSRCFWHRGNKRNLKSFCL